MTKPVIRTPTKDRPLVAVGSASYRLGARELRETLRGSVPFENALDFLVKGVDEIVERR